MNTNFKAFLATAILVITGATVEAAARPHSKTIVVDPTIAELESKLNPARFVRIHRATILNLDHLRELHTWFGGKMVARLKDAKKTELAVSRDRVRALKDRLGV